jgi:hypothetical protein
MTNADLLDLLREARKTVWEWLEMSVPIDMDVLDRIDAALAEQDLPTAVVWKPYGPLGHKTRLGDAEVLVRYVSGSMSEIDSAYSWNVSLHGTATTEAEARRAATAAARGLK